MRGPGIKFSSTACFRLKLGPPQSRTVVTSAWQMQLGDDKSFASIPLPAQFALPPLAYFDLPAKRPR